jgi:HEAT repeat protein
MATTIDDVRAVLDPDEPDYAAAAGLGREAIPHLIALVNQTDASLASKAAYLASLIGTDESVQVLREAATSEHPEVRVAAAAGAQNVHGPAVTDLLLSLVRDQDYGVRRTALVAMPAEMSNELRQVVEAISADDAEPRDVRALASQALSTVPTIKP